MKQTVVWAIFKCKKDSSFREVLRYECNESSIIGICPNEQYAQAYMRMHVGELEDDEDLIATPTYEL